MLNVYVLKKYALLFMSSILPTVTFLMVIMMGQSGLYAGIYAVVIAILMIFVTSWALKNPFTNMLEGKGTLAVTLDSAGLLRFFNVAVVPPFVRGKLDGKEIEDIYDRAAVFNMMPPSKSGGTCYETKDKLFIKLEKNDYEKGRMQVMHYPLFIYNKFIDSIVTKEFISDQEQAVFANHPILYTNAKIQEQTTLLRDFARFFVNQLSPLKSMFKGNMGILIVIVFIVFIGIAIVIAFPQIMESIKSFTGR